MTASDTSITPQPLTRTAPHISVNGASLSDEMLQKLVQVRVERSLCLPGRVTLRFDDVGHVIAKSSMFRLSTAIDIKIESTVIISAVVTAINAMRHRGDNPEYVVVADDKAFKLTRGVQPTTMLNQTYSDAISELASSAGLTASISTQIFPTTPVPYQLRTGTALAYLNALCRRVGAVWWVDGSTLNVKGPDESVGSASLNVNDDMLEFSVRASGLRPTAIEIDSFDIVGKAAVTGSATVPTARGTTPSLVGSYFGQPSALGAAKSSFGTYSPSDATEAGKIATGLLNDAANGSVVARGLMFANPALKPGAKLTLSDSDVFNGDYFISEVEHNYASSGFYTRFVAGPHRSTSLVESLGRHEEDPGLYNGGLVVAKITNIKEDEGKQDLGRVKVQYLSQPGSVESAWARVATIGAGAARGLMYHPVVGDEVIVGFEESDIRRPIVLGSVWGGTVKPAADTVSDANTKVKAVQLASVTGQIIELGDDDADTGKHVQFKTSGGQVMRIGVDKVTLDTKSKPLEITVGSAKITVDDKGNVSISGAKIDIKATQDLSLEGLNVNIKANANVKVEASAQVQVKGMTAEINGSGQTAIKGGVVQIN